MFVFPFNAAKRKVNKMHNARSNNQSIRTAQKAIRESRINAELRYTALIKLNAIKEGRELITECLENSSSIHWQLSLFSQMFKGEVKKDNLTPLSIAEKKALALNALPSKDWMEIPRRLSDTEFSILSPIELNYVKAWKALINETDNKPEKVFIEVENGTDALGRKRTKKVLVAWNEGDVSYPLSLNKGITPRMLEKLAAIELAESERKGELLETIDWVHNGEMAIPEQSGGDYNDDGERGEDSVTVSILADVGRYDKLEQCGACFIKDVYRLKHWEKTINTRTGKEQWAVNPIAWEKRIKARDLEVRRIGVKKRAGGSKSNGLRNKRDDMFLRQFRAMKKAAV